MKKMVFFIFVFSAFMTNTACDHEPYEGEIPIAGSEENPTLPDDFENTFYAKLNGVEFLEQQIYTTSFTDEGDNNFIAIAGLENNYHSIILYIPYDILVGTYHYSPETLLETPNLNITYSNIADLLQSGVGDGYITIEAHSRQNHYIKGRFECTVNGQNGSINDITEGTFEVVYTP